MTLKTCLHHSWACSRCDYTAFIRLKWKHVDQQRHSVGTHATVKRACARAHARTHARTHTHNRLITALCPGLPGTAGTRNVKPIWISLKQETVSGSGISWAICKSAPRSRQTTTPPLSFLQAGCPSCHPTNSVKALKAPLSTYQSILLCYLECTHGEPRDSEAGQKNIHI